jgi:hypothetical protein
MTGPNSSIRRVVPLVLLVVAVSCHAAPTRTASQTVDDAEEPSTMGLGDLLGRLVAPGDIAVIPREGWQRRSTSEPWLMTGEASLMVHALRPLDGEVWVRLESPESLESHESPQRLKSVASAAADDVEALRFTWNGRPLSASRVAVRDGAWTVTLTSNGLDTGTYVLAVAPAADPPLPEASAPAADAELPDGSALPVARRPMAVRISYGIDGAEWPVRRSAWTLRNQLEGFLARSVVNGEDGDRVSGSVFLGPGALPVDIAAPGANGALTFVARNFSAAPATFAMVTSSGVHWETVEAGGHQQVLWHLDPGTIIGELRTEGADEGAFFWEVPRWAFPRPSSDRPPIVLVTLDTVRRDAVGAVVDGVSVTPVLATLAARATVFTRAHSTSSWTLPAHASIFTGLYPSSHGAGVSSPSLRHGVQTLAQQLTSRGYLTVGFGGGVLVSSRWGLARGFHLFRDPTAAEVEAEVLTQEAIDLVDGATGSPFLVFLNYFDAHAPYDPPQAVFQTLGGPELLSSLEMPSLEVMNQRWRAMFDRRSGRAGAAASTPPPGAGDGAADTAADRPLREPVWRAYLAELSVIDAELGRLFDFLRARNLYEQALIIVTSDHGELFGERGHFEHSYRLDPELVEIPLIIKWPHQSASREVSDPVSLVDLFPTILEVAGATVPASDGLALGPTPSAPLGMRAHVLAEEHDESTIHPLVRDRAWFVSTDLYARYGNAGFEIVWRGGSECGQASLEPGANASPTMPGRQWRSVDCAASWPAMLAGINAELPSPPGSASQPLDLDEETLRLLRSLGYIR